MELREDPKVFVNGDYLIGYTTSFRMGQILRYQAELPKPVGVHHEFMVHTFIPAIRDAFQREGFMKAMNRGEDNRGASWSENGQDAGGRFVVASGGQLFLVDNDFQVGIPKRSYLAIGSGAEVAYGALYASRGLGLRERAELALSAAAEHTKCVRPPFTMVEN